MQCTAASVRLDWKLVYLAERVRRRHCIFTAIKVLERFAALALQRSRHTVQLIAVSPLVAFTCSRNHSWQMLQHAAVFCHTLPCSATAQQHHEVPFH